MSNASPGCGDDRRACGPAPVRDLPAACRAVAAAITETTTADEPEPVPRGVGESLCAYRERIDLFAQRDRIAAALERLFRTSISPTAGLPLEPTPGEPVEAVAAPCTMTFAERIRQRVEDALKGVDTGEGPFVKVLEELAEGLCSDRVVAAIPRGEVPGRYYLTLWSRSQPARPRLVLAFWGTATFMRVGNPARIFDDPAKLEEWLADFVAQPDLLETIKELEAVAQESDAPCPSAAP